MKKVKKSRRSSSSSRSEPETSESSNRTNQGKIVIGKNGIPLDVIHDIPSKHESIEYDPEIPEFPEKVELSSNEEEEEYKSHQQEVHTSKFATVMNLLNSMLGAGILSVPNTFVNTGIIFSIVLLIIMAILSIIATDILVYLQLETNSEGLGDLTDRILGRKGSLSLSILNLLFINTALVAYLVLAGDMVTSWFELGGLDITPLSWHALMIFIYGVCIPIALSIPRDISFLRFFSTATVICIIFFCIVLLYKAIDYVIENNEISPTAVLGKCDVSLFASISIYALTFALPSIALSVIRVYDRDAKKRTNAVLIAIVLCFIFVIFPGVCGYIVFGEEADGNILNSFAADDIIIIICRAAFFIIVSCAYPMVTQACQSMWSTLIFNDDSPATLITSKRAIILALTNVIPLLIAMFLPSAKPALSIGGALGGCIVDFVFPALLYIKFYKDRYKLSNWRMVLNMIFIIFGIVAAVIATYQAIVDAIDIFRN